MQTAEKKASDVCTLEDLDHIFDHDRADANFIRLLLAESSRTTTRDSPRKSPGGIALEREGYQVA